MSELINNREHRISVMKDVIKHLHEGKAPEEVKPMLKRLVGETDATEIAAMEQQLIGEGMPVAEVQSMCDMHSQVLREIMVEKLTIETPPGHPADQMRRENAALARILADIRTAMAAASISAGAAGADDALDRWRKGLNDLMDIDKHYRRKEYLWFSCLERHGISGPSKVMWGKDDEVRALLKTLAETLRGAEPEAANLEPIAGTIGEAALGSVEEMIFKEDNILIPMCLNTFTAEEWGEIHAQSPEYGWCLVDPGTAYVPPRAEAPEKIATLPEGNAVVFPTGHLTFEQLLGIFSTLPVDITFVDAQDRVAFFSEGPDRTFERSKSIIGRQVQFCHPPKSVHIVERILKDFRGNRQDAAEFWIDFRGRKIHIRYFAVRKSDGTYLGTLEVTQDLTDLRKLEGERRLLQYETGAN